MGTCESCKHWTEYSGWTDPIRVHVEPYDEEKWRALNEMINGEGIWRVCKGVEENPEVTANQGDGSAIEIPLAATKDGSDYMAKLFTRAEFGCVLYEEKTDG